MAFIIGVVQVEEVTMDTCELVVLVVAAGAITMMPAVSLVGMAVDAVLASVTLNASATTNCTASVVDLSTEVGSAVIDPRNG